MKCEVILVSRWRRDQESHAHY